VSHGTQPVDESDVVRLLSFCGHCRFPQSLGAFLSLRTHLHQSAASKSGLGDVSKPSGAEFAASDHRSSPPAQGRGALAYAAVIGYLNIIHVSELRWQLPPRALQLGQELAAAASGSPEPARSALEDCSESWYVRRCFARPIYE